jgi:uncharacterized protein
MKCFYHSADLDGHCSGAIVKFRYPECAMIGINYGQDFPFDDFIKQPGQTVFMVDFCLQPFEQMERLQKLCNLIWIDHHAKGSIDEAEKRGFICCGSREIGKAGCELVWEYIFGSPGVDFNPMPSAVTLLGRYDVWDHADQAVLPFQYGMRQFKNTLPENQDLWAPLLSSEPTSEKLLVSIIDTGKVILDYEESQNAKFCKAYAFETILYLGDGDVPTEALDAICANRGFTNSKLFDSVYDPVKHHLMITFVRLKPPAHKWTVSLYSTRDDVDCGAIAKVFGGGGHKGAAGFQCVDLPFRF